MEIKIVMHSTLDVHLKPDLELIGQAVADLQNSGREYDQGCLQRCQAGAHNVAALVEQEKALAGQLRLAPPEDKAAIRAQKEEVTRQIDDALTCALEDLALAGGGDLYHYNYDLHFNRIVAGLMGSTCYMKETFDALQQKRISSILAIASTVETNGHHSTFGHSHLTLEISGIPKALAMIINNEKEYCTSEKSARYTVMTDIEPTQNALFQRWRERLEEIIIDTYGQKRPFFDAKNVKAQKLAQENARYMISVFTPSNMVYTTSFRQLNYLAHWFENTIADPSANEFYRTVFPQMKQFVDFVKNNGLYSDAIEDHKGRGLTLFGDGLIKQVVSDSVYAISYPASFACLAQLQRHRTIHYNIDQFDFTHAKKAFFTPAILQGSPELLAEWQRDIASVGQDYPQGMLATVVEKGEISDYILKAYERVCVCAQKEIRDLTSSGCLTLATELRRQEIDARNDSISLHNRLLSKEGQGSEQLAYRAQKQDYMLARLDDKIGTLEKLSQGARCTAGYKCTSPCRFPEGVNLESKV